MSYEAAMKHYPKDKPKPTREEWEASLKRLEGLDLPIPDFRPPIPLAVHFLEAKAEAEERRHQELLEAIKAVAKGRDKQAQTKKGPSPETRERFRMFKAMKDAHTEYSYEKVAIEINFLHNTQYKGEDVRNAYRAMDATWERADKIR